MNKVTKMTPHGAVELRADNDEALAFVMMAINGACKPEHQKTATQIAAHLRRLKIPVLAVSESDFLEDGEVIITDKVHVQVGNDGQMGVVVERSEDSFEFLPTRSFVADLIKDLRVEL